MITGAFDLLEFLSEKVYVQRVQDPQTGNLVLKKQPFTVQPYEYNLTFTAVGANGGSQAQTLQFAANGDYCITGFAYFPFDNTTLFTTNSQPVLQGRIQIVDSGSSQQYSQVAIPLAVLAGMVRDSNPAPIEFPRIVSGKSALTVTYTNLDNVARTFDLTLKGVKIETYGDPYYVPLQ